MIGEINSKIPEGPIADKWSSHKFDMKLVNPANKRKFEVIVASINLLHIDTASLIRIWLL